MFKIQSLPLVVEVEAEAMDEPESELKLDEPEGKSTSDAIRLGDIPPCFKISSIERWMSPLNISRALRARSGGNPRATICNETGKL